MDACLLHNSLVNPVLPTGGVGEAELLADANDLPGDRLKEDEVVRIVLSDLSVHQVVPELWIRKGLNILSFL